MPETASILTQTARGAGWIIGWRMTTRLLGVLSTLVLVRLLAPDDFGLVALAAGFWQAIDAMSSLGVEEALVREKAPDRALYDTGFTINALRGLATAAIIVAGAWPFAWFFAEPRLVPVLLALATAAFLNGLENIGIVDFRRQMDFRKEFVLSVFPRFASIVVTIGVAVVLRSHWALVAGILLSTGLRILGGYLLHPYRPRLSLSSWSVIAGFSFWSWAISVAILLRDRIDVFVIGRLLGLGPVGIYAVATEIAALPTTELVSPLGRACFSAFAAARNTGLDLGGTYLRLLGSAAFLGVPAGVGISLMAGPIVHLAFGDRWNDAVLLVQVLGCTLTVSILGTMSAAFLNAHAVLRQQVWVQIASILVRLVAMVALARAYGLVGAAIGASVAVALENIWYTALALRRLEHQWADAARQLWRPVLASSAMAAALWGLGLGWRPVAVDSGETLAVLILGVASGAVIYAMLTMGLWLLAGGPDGAERDALAAMRAAMRRVRR
jgi:lipopolysaccharide exporter